MSHAAGCKWDGVFCGWLGGVKFKRFSHTYHKRGFCIPVFLKIGVTRDVSDLVMGRCFSNLKALIFKFLLRVTPSGYSNALGSIYTS